MQPAPTQTQTNHYREILNELIDMGAELARQIHKQATQHSESKPAEDPTIPFDRIARTIRRTIALAQALDNPHRAQPGPPDRTTIRKKIIRRIEDALHTSVKGPEAETLDQEFRERLDAPEFDDEINTRPIDDIIEDIRRDLGLRARAGLFQWKRRTPQDVRTLNAQAAAPPNTEPPRKTHQPEPTPPTNHRHNPETIRLCLAALAKQKPNIPP